MEDLVVVCRNIFMLLNPLNRSMNFGEHRPAVVEMLFRTALLHAQ